MADAGEGLSAGAIANPRLWRLGMELDMDGATLAVAAASSVGEEDMLVRRIGLASGIAPLRALEDAVYDNSPIYGYFLLTLHNRNSAVALIIFYANN